MFDKLKGQWRTARLMAAFSLSGALPSEVRTMLAGSALVSAGVHVSPDHVLSISAAKRAIELIAGSLASTPLILYRRRYEKRAGRILTWYEEATDDPRYDALRVAPSSDVDAFEFVETVITQMLVFGQSVVYNGRRARKGSTVPELRILEDPDSVRAERPKNQQLSPMQLVAGETGKVVRDAEFIRFRWTSLGGVRSGGLREWAQQSLSLSVAASSAWARFLANGMMVGGIAAPDQPLSPKQWTELKDAIADGSKEDSGAGWRHAGQLFIPPVPLKILANVVTARDSQLHEARRFQAADVARYCGVPAFMISDEVAVVRANAQVGETAFVKYTLRPWAARFEAALKRGLFGDDPDLFPRFDLDELTRGDRRQELESDRIELETSQASPNELRSKRRRAPSDEPDADKLHIATNNLSPLGAQATIEGSKGADNVQTEDMGDGSASARGLAGAQAAPANQRRRSLR